MRKLLLLIALVVTTKAIGADNPISCTGNSCKVQLKPRNSGGTQVTGLEVSSGSNSFGVPGNTSTTDVHAANLELEGPAASDVGLAVRANGTTKAGTFFANGTNRGYFLTNAIPMHFSTDATATSAGSISTGNLWTIGESTAGATADQTIYGHLKLGTSAAAIPHSMTNYRNVGNKKGSIIFPDSIAPGDMTVATGIYYDGSAFKRTTANTNGGYFNIQPRTSATQVVGSFVLDPSVSHAADSSASFVTAGSYTGQGAWTLGLTSNGSDITHALYATGATIAYPLRVANTTTANTGVGVGIKFDQSGTSTLSRIDSVHQGSSSTDLQLVTQSSGTLTEMARADGLKNAFQVKVPSTTTTTSQCAGPGTLCTSQWAPTWVVTAGGITVSTYVAGNMRVGNMVYAQNRLDANSATAGTTWTVRGTLPVGTNLLNVNDLNGSGTCQQGDGTMYPIYIQADTANDQVLISGRPTHSSNHPCSFTFGYIMY